MLLSITSNFLELHWLQHPQSTYDPLMDLRIFLNEQRKPLELRKIPVKIDWPVVPLQVTLNKGGKEFNRNSGEILHSSLIQEQIKVLSGFHKWTSKHREIKVQKTGNIEKYIKGKTRLHLDQLSLEVPPPLMFPMTVTPLGRDQDCNLKNREPEVPAPWFLDPGGWSKTTEVRLYFIFPGICTLSLVDKAWKLFIGFNYKAVIADIDKNSEVRALDQRKHGRCNKTLNSYPEILLNSLAIVTVTKEIKWNCKEDNSRYGKNEMEQQS
ncbi:hypothetical protein STEG23_006729 [Scotinomys teguina]